MRGSFSGASHKRRCGNGSEWWARAPRAISVCTSKGRGGIPTPVGRGSARAVARDDTKGQCLVTSRGSDGRRRSADAELWRPCESDVARGNRGGVGSLALPPGSAPLPCDTNALKEPFGRLVPVERRRLPGVLSPASVEWFGACGRIRKPMPPVCKSALQPCRESKRFQQTRLVHRD